MTESLSFGWVFLAGVLSFLSPCVLPLIPSYICYITGSSMEQLQSGEGLTRTTTFHSLSFILGFSLIFILLGASATYLSTKLYDYQKWIQYIGGGLILLFGVHLMGLLPIQWLMKEKKFQFKNDRVGYFRSFLFGIVFSVGWTPCVGPILASVLLYASTKETVGMGVLLLTVYSLGLGIPFFLSSIAFNRFLSSFQGIKKYLLVIEKFTGVLLVLIGILIITNSLAWLTGSMTQWMLPISQKLNI